jgi:all-trans-retinol dehydrogenase (NAD+)
MRSLHGKRVLITGSGQGLGRAIADQFARAGAEVIITDRDYALVEAAVAELHKAGQRAVGYLLDVTLPEQIATVRSRLLAEHGPLDVLVNNAGIVFGGPFVDTPIDRHRTTLAVNLIGVLEVTQAFLPDLLTRPEGHVVFISSASALIALPFATTYAASKWAVLGFAESLREELRVQGQHHVSITSVCPSYVDTGMFHGVRPPRFIPWLRPEQVAQATLRAVERRRELVLMPWPVKVMPILGGILPRGLYRRLCAWLGVTTSMVEWRGREG